MRDSLLAISSGEWLFLAGGLILGTCLWLVINRNVVRRVIALLKARGTPANPMAFYESVMGFAILAFNCGLLYIATLIPSYFLFSFALTGLLVGGWVALPADH